MSALPKTDKDAELQELGKSCAESIAEMVAALECDYARLEELRERVDDSDAEALDEDEKQEYADLLAAAGECESREDAEQRIKEDPLSIEVRSGWYLPGGDESQMPEEFCILLGTGGPAVRIRGELDANCEPSHAWIETQNWFTPWTEYRGNAITRGDLLTYCCCFYFSNG